MKKYCTKCGHEFEAVGREVICPACKAQAAEEVKKAAVLRAKLASWTGESVPVRISGRASTVIREFGASHTMTFAAALDALLKASDYVASTGKAWEDITPYKSRRRGKATSTPDTPDTPQDVQTAQDVSQDVTSKPQEPQEPQEPQDPPHDIKQAAKSTSKASASKATSKATSKASKVSKASKASKASK